MTDLDLQLAEHLDSPALGSDHVSQDSGFGPSSGQRLTHVVHVDQRSASAPAIFFNRHERDDAVGAYIFAETQRDDAVRYHLHLYNFNIARLAQARYIERMKLARKDQVIVGDGIELRPHARRNYELYGRWYSNPTIWHLTSWTAEPLRPRDVERLFEDREASTTERSFAIHLPESQKPLGIISLMNISKAHASADLSIILGDSDNRARGYGTEAIRTILDYAFADLRLHRVGLSVFDFNDAALKTYERLGFQREGCLRGAVKRDETHRDAILMSILAPEWNAQVSQQHA